MSEITARVLLEAVDGSEEGLLQARTLRLSALGLTGGLEELVLMSSVHTLFLNDNRFCSLAGLEFLLRLKCLYCSYNQITSLAPLCALPALQVLDVRSNQLQAFENVACLPPSLRMLSLAGNPCCSLPGYPAAVLRLLPQVSELDRVPTRPGVGGGSSSSTTTTASSTEGGGGSEISLSEIAQGAIERSRVRQKALTEGEES